MMNCQVYLAPALAAFFHGYLTDCVFGAPHLRHSSAVPAIFSKTIWIQAYLFYNSMCSDRWYSYYQIPQLSFLLTRLTLGFGIFSIPNILCTILILFCSERISLISFSYLPKRLRKTVMVISFWSPWGGHTVTFQYSDCFSTPNLTEDNDLQWIFFWHFCKCH